MGRKVSKRDSSVSSQQSASIGNHSKPQVPYQQERQPAPDRTLLQFSFQIGNERARKAYKRKRQRSINLYARASVSFLDAEYDFQYKFFPDDVYQQLEHEPEAVGFDPWEWARKTPESSDVDAYNAYHQFNHGMRLQEMVLHRRSELMEALFPLRTSNMLQCMSWPELEYSYGLHLSNVIERLGFAKRDNAIGYTDSDITSVLIETGRFFTELDYSNRPKDFREGNNPDAAGPFLNGPWSEDTRNRFNLNELHRRCHENGLIKDWEYNNILRVVFNSNSRTGTTERQSQLTQTEKLVRRPISEEESQMFILDFLGLFDVPDSRDDIEQSNDPVFAAHDLNLQTLMNLGGLRIVWSDCIDNHLRLSTSSRTLTLFWDVSLLDQSLLFWYNAQSLKTFGDNMGLDHPDATRNPKLHVLYELKITYRLLFHNIKAKQFTTTETCAIKNANRRTGILAHDLRVDINSWRARKILKHFLNAPLPGKLGRGNIDTARPRQFRHVWWRIGRALRILHSLTHRNPLPRTISTHLASGPPYSLDLCWHLENILTPYPALVGESESMRSFSHFPRFSSRLREIKFYMDNQKPSGWYQMWKDKRDRVQHVTFWAVLVFGTISITLALISIAVSSAQTVAAFRSVGGGHE
ncbi:MAG: hypothetical protein ALECFALPRED_004952 [Alectoria fallacina]|uniref:Uncharacterized protein n=1 Tax=Alectoria fallacina TaxID=1903189 RepID=A0A8H3G106_9LECA|nr:MAG: hypothetical protein ALECFALPRED_004952 [Alectoria fallacina]